MSVKALYVPCGTSRHHDHWVKDGDGYSYFEGCPATQFYDEAAPFYVLPGNIARSTGPWSGRRSVKEALDLLHQIRDGELWPEPNPNTGMHDRIVYAGLCISHMIIADTPTEHAWKKGWIQSHNPDTGMLTYMYFGKVLRTPDCSVVETVVRSETIDAMRRWKQLHYPVAMQYCGDSIR